MKTITILVIFCFAALPFGLSQENPRMPMPNDLYESGHLSREGEFLCGLYAPLDVIGKNLKSRRVCRMSSASGWGRSVFAVLCWLDQGKAPPVVVLYSVTLEVPDHDYKACVTRIAQRDLSPGEIKAADAEFDPSKADDIGDSKFIPGGRDLGEEAGRTIFETWEQGKYRRGVFVSASFQDLPSGLLKKRQLFEKLIDTPSGTRPRR